MQALISNSEESALGLDRVRAHVIARRLPMFALLWMASMLIWATVLAVDSGGVLVPAVAVLIFQGSVLGIALGLCRAQGLAGRLLAAAVSVSLLLGISTTVFCALIGAHGEVLAFLLLTLYLMTALLFGWGWRCELLVLAVTMTAWTLSTPYLGSFLPSLQTVTAVVIGSVLSVALAEGHGYHLRQSAVRRERERRIMRALAESRDAYRDLAENARDFIWAIDLEGRFTYVNDALARLLGEPAAALIGCLGHKFWTDHPDNPAFEPLLARVVGGEAIPAQVMQARTMMGLRWIEVVPSAVRDLDGRAVGVRGIGRDVTERRWAEEKLRESEERFRSAFDHASIGMSVVGIDRRPVQVNRALCEMLGYDAQELLARSVDEVGHPEDLEKGVELGLRLLRGEIRSFEMEKRYWHKDGHIVWALLSASLVRDRSGQPLYVIALIQDITERKQTGDALRASEARYRGLVESQQDFIVRLDLEGRFTFVSDSYCEKMGKTRDQLLGQSFRALVDERDRAAIDQTMQQLMSPPHRARVELRNLTREGRRWISWEGCAITDERGLFVEVQSVGRDVTERRAAEEALRASEARYRGLVESQQDLIVRMDATTRITFVNDAYCEAFGLTRQDTLGKTAGEMRALLVHPDDLPETMTAIQTLTKPPYRGRVDNRTRTPMGWRWISWEACAIRDEHGKVVEVQSVGRDVTERRTAEETLRGSLEELRRSEEKLRLLAQRQVMIREDERKRLGFDLHDDVCQELVGISILVESARRRLGPMPAESAGELQRVVRYLNEVVEHLRLLARELRPMLLHDLGLEGSLRSLAAGMSSADTSVVALFPTAIPRLPEETELAVYRIAQEALANSMRHAEAHSIVLTLAAADGRLRLEVRDDGRGFEPGDRRAEALGLVSMEERALALGGRLELWSERGKGTTVCLECPLIQRAPASAA